MNKLAGKTMTSRSERTSPAKKAHRTARWARTMTKWLIAYSQRKGARWNTIGFGGKRGSESRGIVDMIAIRKDHRHDGPALKRGDLFEIVLIQVKGGGSTRPTEGDIIRLKQVARHHKATAIVLAEWKRGSSPQLFKLYRSRWRPVRPEEVFS